MLALAPQRVQGVTRGRMGVNTTGQGWAWTMTVTLLPQDLHDPGLTIRAWLEHLYYQGDPAGQPSGAVWQVAQDPAMPDSQGGGEFTLGPGRTTIQVAFVGPSTAVVPCVDTPLLDSVQIDLTGVPVGA